jgi:hypothetical protein
VDGIDFVGGGVVVDADDCCFAWARMWHGKIVFVLEAAATTEEESPPVQMR